MKRVNLTLEICNPKIRDFVIDQLYFADKELIKVDDDNFLVLSDTEKYHRFIYRDDGVYGCYYWNDEEKEARLRESKFWINRGVRERKVSVLIETIVAYRYAETCEFDIINSLVDGYNNTRVNSCMKGCGNFYRAFEGVGVLLVGTLEDGTEGRAIIWNNVHGLPEDCMGFMDRIYPSENRNVVEAFKSYAVKNNLAHKLEQTWGGSYFVFNGETYDNPLYITINDEYECVRDVDELPYMDTFRYTNGNDKKLHSCANGYKYTLDETSGVNPCAGNECAVCGARIGPDEVVCDECDDNCVYCVDTGNHVDVDDAWYAEDTEEYYEDRSNIIICAACGNVYTRNSLAFEQDGCQYCDACADDDVYCVDIERYCHIGDAYYAQDTEEYYALRDDLFKCKSCGEYFTKNSMVLLDDLKYCSECANKVAEVCYDA